MTEQKKTGDNSEILAQELARREAELSQRELEIARRESELDLRMIEAGGMTLASRPFDLRECVESAPDLVSARASEKRIDIAILFEGDVPALRAIVGDPIRLRQVLLNLLSNAVKFTEMGEVLLVVTSSLRDQIAGLTFTVRDTGVGFSPESADSLFRGPGLGISKRLVELMGGKLEAYSEGPGKGSTFMFTIRAPIAQLTVQSQRELDGTQPGLSGKRVLIIDDNETNRSILFAQAEKWGMIPRGTGLSFEAIQWIKNEDIFDIAILDMHMPEMNGIELARRIRRHGAKFPLVLFGSTGRHETGGDESLFAARLSKPIKQSKLFDTLEAALADNKVERVERRSLDRIILDPETASRHPLRILIAEDKPANQKLISRLLAQMGYRPDVASNGLEAADASRRGAYDLIFMDVQMPEMDGLEAARVIRREMSQENQPRIVAMTAKLTRGDRELCLAAGMNDCISKPIKALELLDALEQTR
ncbi:MAG: response regulator [Chloroflexi bacterium]|nr:response regulator [Chloroflexota bacterium]